MPSVKFDSVNLDARTAIFEVDGQLVTRGIANHITDVDLDAHLVDLARGLAIEYTPPVVPVLTKSPTVQKGDVLITAGEVATETLK